MINYQGEYSLPSENTNQSYFLVDHTQSNIKIEVLDRVVNEKVSYF
jgi:hypothetical protein